MMKDLSEKIKKYWPYIVYGIFIAIYESSVHAELVDKDYIPTWVKSFLGIAAAIGMVLKFLPKPEGGK